MGRRALAQYPMPFDNFPEIVGELTYWSHPDKDSLIHYSSGTKVDYIIPRGGTITDNLVQNAVVAQGDRTLNSINNRAALMNYRSYTVGSTSTFNMLHDRAASYGIFTVFKLSAGAILYSTTTGGNTNGTFLQVNSNGSITKLLRNGNGTTSNDLITGTSAAGLINFNQWYYFSDIFYGYQVSGNDCEISLNNDSPTFTYAQCNTSAIVAGNSATALTLGTPSSANVYSTAIFFVVNFAGMTRTQIDADITNIKSFINLLFKPW